MPEANLHAVIDTVRRAWYSGRRIVPIVGAGLSADSGIPTILSLVRYFSKFQQYLDLAAYLPGNLADVPEHIGLLKEEFKKHPWKYVETLGWPDRFELHQNLLIRLEESAKVRDVRQRLIEEGVKEGLATVLDRTNFYGRRQFRGLKEEVEKAVKKSRKKALIDAALRPFEWQGGDCREFRLIGDWKKIIQHFANYQADFADSLFHRLTGNRGPGTGHRFLSFLVKLLAVRQIFTFNFDDLIERSLAAEGIEHQVFGMEHGAELPYEGLLRDQLSVIKMHGSNHGLLLDERLDHPLDAKYKERFRRLVGRAPLLLVVGCSGGDYRLQDLVNWAMAAGESGPGIAWLHFEGYVPDVVQELRNRCGAQRVISAMTANPGFSIQHIYSALAGRHPSSTHSYATSITRPLPLVTTVDDRAKIRAEDLADKLEAEPCVVFSTLDVVDEPDCYAGITASEFLVHWSAHWSRNGFQTIWVDLESSHSLAAVVASIIDQCRRFDPSLAPSVLPLLDDLHTDVINAAVRRVRDALRRSRYVVIFDGLEAYLWPPTYHHGEPSQPRGDTQKRLDTLRDFLRLLSADSIGGSKLFVGIDESKPRFPDDKRQHSRVVRRYQKLIQSLEDGNNWKRVELPYSSLIRFTDVFQSADALQPFAGPSERMLRRLRVLDDFGNPADTWALILHLLSSVRRPRHLASLRQLLRPFFRSAAHFEKLLRLIAEGTVGRQFGLSRLEGGHVWFHRWVRDRLYTENSKFTDAKSLGALLGPGRPDEATYRAGVAQSFLLATAHLWISRVYYNGAFVQSHDAAAFMEYTYHRVSGIRYLVRLLGLARRAMNDKRLKKCVTEGFTRFVEFIDRAVLDPVCRTELREEMSISEWKKDPFGFPTLRQRLEERHAREIRSLARAWSRAEPLLRSQIPAEQLLTWTDALLADDICDRFDRVVIGYGGAKPHFYDPPRRAGRLGVAADAIREFISVLADLRVKLNFERSDYARAAWERLKILTAMRSGDETDLTWFVPSSEGVNAREIAIEVAEVEAERLNGVPLPRLSMVHYLIDVTVSLIKRAQEDPAGDPKALMGLLEHVRSILEQIDEQRRQARWAAYLSTLPEHERAIAEGDYHEAWLRYRHLSAEVAFGGVCVFAAKHLFLGRPPTPDGLEQLRADATVAGEHVAAGLKQVRGQAPRGDGRFRSLILEPAADGSVYLPYRSALLILQGRVRWLAAARDQDIANGDPERFRDAFEAAYSSFELSRGGLSPNNRLIGALTELYTVEASLARARILLHPRCFRGKHSTTDPEVVQGVIEEAYAKYESARLCLQRARSHLLTGRRNVVWWKLFFLLAAQYHADRLALGLLRVLARPVREGATSSAREQFMLPTSDDGRNAVPVRPVPGEFLLRLQRGYSAVRAALDYQFPGEGGLVCWPWLHRVWLEMTLTAYAFGHLYLAPPDGNSSAQRERREEQIASFIRHYNVTARLVDSISVTADPPIGANASGQPSEWIGEWIGPEMRSRPEVVEVRRWLEQWFTHPPILSCRGQDALCFRQNLLEKASEVP